MHKRLDNMCFKFFKLYIANWLQIWLETSWLNQQTIQLSLNFSAAELILLRV